MKVKVKIAYSVIEVKEKEIILEQNDCVSELDVVQAAQESIKDEGGGLLGYGVPHIVEEGQPVDIYRDGKGKRPMDELTLEEKETVANQVITALNERGFCAMHSHGYRRWSTGVGYDEIMVNGYINRRAWEMTIPITNIENTYLGRKQTSCLLSCKADCAGEYHNEFCMDGEHYFYSRIEK